MAKKMHKITFFPILEFRDPKMVLMRCVLVGETERIRHFPIMSHIKLFHLGFNMLAQICHIDTFQLNVFFFL